MSFSNATNVVEQLLNSEEFYDCTFLVGKKNEAKKVRALRAHLGHISPVFKNMLYSKDSKYSSFSRDEPIELYNVTPDAFNAILRTSYGLDYNVNITNVVGVIAAAKHFEIPFLIRKTQEKIRNKITPNNALVILNTFFMLDIWTFDELVKVELLDSGNAMKKCLVSILPEYSTIKCEYFIKHLDLRAIEIIIRHPICMWTEEELWSALVKWAKYQASGVFEEEKVDNTDGDNNDNNMNDINKIKLGFGGENNDYEIEFKQQTIAAIKNDFNNGKLRKKPSNNGTKTKNNLTFELLQPFIKHIRFLTMSNQYFFNYVRQWLKRDDLELIMGHIFVNKGDKTLTKDDIESSYKDKNWLENQTHRTMGNGFHVISTSVNENEAKKVENIGVKGRWSAQNMKTCKDQWFIIQLLCDIGPKVKVEWTNYYSDNDTIKNIIIYGSNKDSKKIEDINENNWFEIMKWESKQTRELQTFELNTSQCKSPFIKFQVIDTYGGYTCLANLRITPIV